MRSEEAELRRANLERDTDVSALRLTVDHPADLDVIRAVVEGVGRDAPLERIIHWAEAHPDVMDLNAAHRSV